MIDPGLPPEERARLQVLASLGVLDTPREERYDRVTRLAKRLFDVPWTAVALVDATREWVKSGQGVPWIVQPLEHSLAAAALRMGGQVVVEDTEADLRFHDHPMVREHGIRFLAAHPLTTDDGLCLGYLTLMDHEPRPFDQEEGQTLADLAAMVTTELTASLRANTDPLTGLPNRRGFGDLASWALANGRRTGQPLSMLVIDLDGFPDIVTSFGPDCGAEALLETAALLRACFRGSDATSRIGDARFCVLLTGATVEQLEIPLRRFEALVTEANAAREAFWSLQYSVGYAGFDPMT
ncbi:MAG: sensor domain-containing diguanylate cyclase, partial [Myxococcales bacterium]|nr:sensor domain-containing diguanylate cyclase [Myxococcales bacterium]